MIDFLSQLAMELGEGVWSVAAGLVGWAMGLLADLIILLSAVLPETLFELPQLAGMWETGLGWLNWFVPIGQMEAVLAAWAAATVGYYTFQYILKHVGK